MSYINIKDEWKLFIGYIILVILLLLSGCTSSPSGAIVIPHKEHPTYSITEPLGTIHTYRTKPLIIDNKRLELYCLIHSYPEVIIKLRTGEWRVRQWKR
jgi:hypothetical protein